MYFWDASCCIDLLCDLSVPFSPHGHTLLVNMGVSIGPDRSHKENCCVRAAGQVRTLINARAKIYKYNSDFKKSNNEVGLKKKTVKLRLTFCRVVQIVLINMSTINLRNCCMKV